MPGPYYFFRATLLLLLAFGRAAWYFRWRLADSLNLPDGLAMDSKEKHRLKHYFFGTSYLAALMCCLRNQPRSGREKYLFTNLSALAYSFDDLAEAFRDDDLSVFWKNNPEDYGLATDKRGLALHLLNNIYRVLPEQALEQFQGYMHRVFNVELTGSKQFGGQEKITAEKGGCSVLLFRSLLDHRLSEEEENALYQFGFLIQCCDDIFDLWHDHQAGIPSLASTLAERGEIELLTKIFEHQVAATQMAFRQTAYPSIQVETTLSMIHYLVSITRLCLQHYSELKYKYGALPLADRTAIVVDMEVWTNRFRAIRYLLRPI